MAHIDPIAGIAEPHQSTVATILRAVGQGLFTMAEADMLIERIRAHMIAVPVPGTAVPKSVIIPGRTAGEQVLIAPHEEQTQEMTS